MGSSREIKLKEDFRENDAVNTKHFDQGLYFTQLKDTAELHIYFTDFVLFVRTHCLTTYLIFLWN